MRTLYVSQQGCTLSLEQETIWVKRQGNSLEQVQIPLLEQILIFGQSQVTTQVIRACLQQDVPIAYLSRMGYCYGRILPIERGYRSLAERQRQLSPAQELGIARSIVEAKLLNSRVLLMRQRRSQGVDRLPIDSLNYLAEQVRRAEGVQQVRGLEGAGAAAYFPALGSCLRQPGFTLLTRTRRPPTNPVNAMLSFGYQVLWNHILTLIELQGLDPYQGCLHASSERHAALVSDLIEEFRAPIVDSLMVWLVNTGVMNADQDFEYHDGGCFLNESGRRKYLQSFVQRMEGMIQAGDEGEQPRWDLLTRQVRSFKEMIYSPELGYSPYRIR